MKTILFYFLALIVTQSCTNRSTAANTKSIDDLEQSPIHVTSRLRPDEQLEVEKLYMDTVHFWHFNDEGDYLICAVIKNKDTIALHHTEVTEFIRGEQLLVTWKMDSIWYPDDEEKVEYAEWFVSAKRLKPVQLANKKIKFLWREMQIMEEYGIEYNGIVLNEQFIQTITEPEKAALAYLATEIGNECEWDGRANEDRSNLKCKILWALGLGYQCSSSHLDFIRFWFRNNSTILKELKNCSTTPDGATVQDTFDEIELEVKDNIITIFFKASGYNMRESKNWHWTEKHTFEFKNNELLVLKKEITPKILTQ